MKKYWSLSVSRAVSQVITRVHKPKVEYKLAPQEKPQGSILTYYYKTNNLSGINWLNTRRIIASNKSRHEIPFKTKRFKYTAIWRKSIKIVKESKLSFFTTFPSFVYTWILPNSCSDNKCTSFMYWHERMLCLLVQVWQLHKDCAQGKMKTWLRSPFA